MCEIYTNDFLKVEKFSLASLSLIGTGIQFLIKTSNKLSKSYSSYLLQSRFVPAMMFDIYKQNTFYVIYS